MTLLKAMERTAAVTKCLCAMAAAWCLAAPAMAELPNAPHKTFRVQGGSPSGMALSPDGNFTLVADRSPVLRVFSVKTGGMVRKFTSNGDIRIALWSPDGRTVAGAGSGRIWLWNYASGKIVRHLGGQKSDLNAAAFSPDGKMLACAGEDRTLRVYRLSDGMEAAVITSGAAPLVAAIFSADGKHLADAGADNRVRLFRVSDWALQNTFETAARVSHAAISADGSYIAAVGADGKIYAFNTVSGATAQLGTRDRTASAAAFSPSGRYLAGVGTSAGIRLWDMQTFQLAATLQGGKGDAVSVAWNRDGSGLAALSADGSVNLWKLSLLDIPGAAPQKSLSPPTPQQKADAKSGAYPERGYDESPKGRVTRLFSGMLSARMLMLILVSAGLIFTLMATMTDMFLHPEKVFEEKSSRYEPPSELQRAPGGFVFPKHTEKKPKQEAESAAAESSNVLSQLGKARASAQPPAHSAGPEFFTNPPLMVESPKPEPAPEPQITALPARQIMQPPPPPSLETQQPPPPAAAESEPRPLIVPERGKQPDAAPPPPAPPAKTETEKPSDMVSGKYRLLREVGRGGMAIVYEAVDIQLDKKFALKKMKEGSSLSERERKRFIEEARITAKLRHPNIVDIYSINEEGADIYLVFEFVDGKTLENLLTRYRHIPAKQCVAISNHILSALDYAHSKGVVHRDLKPSNIMVADDGFVRVMDFGIAQLARLATATRAGADISGTLAYMAPEQHLGKYDSRADIFAFGATLYEMATGRLTFPGPDFLSQKREAHYKKPSQVTQMPQALEDLIVACLHPDKAMRPASAQEVQARLRDLKL
ncbi:MAG: protein kinase [Elusimicrobiales bacterium]